eukprot:1160533-Pelagomonas_calceolata.AAC.3
MDKSKKESSITIACTSAHACERACAYVTQTGQQTCACELRAIPPQHAHAHMNYTQVAYSKHAGQQTYICDCKAMPPPSWVAQSFLFFPLLQTVELVNTLTSVTAEPCRPRRESTVPCLISYRYAAWSSLPQARNLKHEIKKQ